MATTGLRVEVLLFARLRDLAGVRSVAVEVGLGATPREAWAAATAIWPRLGGPAPPPGLRVAVDEEYAAWDQPLHDGATVAFIPPVAGGAVGARLFVELGEETLDPRRLETLVRGDADGAVCTFTGVVRDHNQGRTVTRLEYQAYAGMAEAEMRRIGEDVLERTGAGALALSHRLGSLLVGEASVVVSAAAAHRDTAFDACRLAIDALKAQVPIWKREHTADGELWVGDPAGEPAEG